jgi:transcriptional antiterminator NusG
MIYTVRVTVGKEKSVLDQLASIKERGEYEVYSVLHTPLIRGYVFLEASTEDEAKRFVYNVTNIKGVAGETPMEQIEKFLAPKKIEITLDKGDIVELISGPFRGEKGKVIRISKQKEEIVVELLEAAVPIPLTVKIDSVRLIKHE